MNTQVCIRCKTKAIHLVDGLCINCVNLPKQVTDEDYWEITNTPPAET